MTTTSSQGLYCINSESALRISICVQLGILVFLATSIGLTVVALATWYTNHTFVKDVRSNSLALSASLKSAQLSSNLLLMQTLVRQATLRRSPQAALEIHYREGRSTTDQWNWTAEDYDAMFAGSKNSRIALQARIYHKEDAKRILFSRTASSVRNETLPYERPDGQFALMGDQTFGYIPQLYPQFDVRTINHTSEQYEASYCGKVIDRSSPLFSGPYRVSDQLTLVSITMPIVNNTSVDRTIGWLTVVLDARLIKEVVESRDGLGYSGINLIVGPYNTTNHFPAGFLFSTPDYSTPDDFNVHFVLPSGSSGDLRRNFDHGTAPPFDWALYPAVRDGFASATGNRNNAGSELSTTNEQNSKISMGHAVVNSTMVDWMIVVERSHSEVWAPINRLRRVIISCAFGTMAGMLALTFPLTHYLSRPVRRLRDATRTTVQPQPSKNSILTDETDAEDKVPDMAYSLRSALLRYMTHYRRLFTMGHVPEQKPYARKHFIIPSEVKDGKHMIHDELTELTETFNKMVRELMTQYEELEERVQQRTAELESSKEVAEAANKSKTLFIANISHEIKTPLNGIMGMLAVCLSEDNPPKLKQSLEIIYKSGVLLSNLLTELLTFSQIEFGQHSSLDEKKFKLRDIGTQILAIFGQQAEEGGNILSVRFEGPHSTQSDMEREKDEGIAPITSTYEPLEDMLLYGDDHLILRVILHLVSNSLKFTPAGGTVTVNFRCNGELDLSDGGKVPIPSRNSSYLGSKFASSTAKDEPASTAASHRNAPEYAQKPRSTISITPDMILHRSKKQSSEEWLSVEIEVQDTGLGIPEHLHSKIFEPFVQGDLSLNKKYSGTGLGLSICSRLANLLKGGMSMRSQVGQGSVFMLTLPLRYLPNKSDSMASSTLDTSTAALRGAYEKNDRYQSSGTIRAILPTRSVSSATVRVGARTRPSPGITSEPNLESRSVGAHRIFFASTSSLVLTPSSEFASERLVGKVTEYQEAVKVLVAEDNKTNQEVIRRMLKLEGLYNVTIAVDGLEAVARVKESLRQQDPYMLILMDVQMPNLDGLQATKIIRQEGFRAPIVALSAYTAQANMNECLNSGMNAFLSKPILRSALRNILRTYLPAINKKDKGEIVAAVGS
ncbi:hypothetical protein OPT61_g5342 [Boeremia exigua]|uniref:Uncharacterized protein n=1 Tax=Boeremia exigua TaxID=749465 RepID=A0ACC2IAN8_9PLEO|nr:hypothetical protein OPT61_g5342 [Boeremia exigua]